MTISETDLFKQLVQLESDKLILAEDVKQVKSDSAYDPDVNPQGISKEEIKLIHKAAILEARNQFEEQKEASDAVFKKYIELTGYNE